MINNYHNMENGTAYSYLINSIDKLKFYDITSISTDYILRLSKEQMELLYNEINSSIVNKKSCNNLRLPQTEAQFHAYMYAKGLETRRNIFDLLSEDEKDLHCSKDIAIIDYDCGIGLYTLSFVDYLKSTNSTYNIKEILLIEANSFCLERAELLVRSLVPEVQVRTINKKANLVCPDEIRLEHALVYNIACGRERSLDFRVIRNAFKEGRYLFAKLIEKRSTIYDRKIIDFAYESFFYSNAAEYSIWENFDFDSVFLATTNEDTSNFYEKLFKPSQVYGDVIPDDDCYVKTMESQRFSKSPSICFTNTQKALDKSILAKLNYINCLRFGIGCEVNLEEAEALLKAIKGKYNENIQRIIIRLLSVCCKDKEECILYAKEYLRLEMPETNKCATRSNLAGWIKENDKEQAETLYKLCVEHGCETCQDAHSYNELAKHCPKAQYFLSELLKDRSPQESLQLLKDSASQCYVPALNAMGHHYLESGETEENIRKAAGMFEQAANLGSHVAPLLAFVCLEKSDPTKALWYLALACKYNSERAKNYMIQMIPKVISGKRRDLLVEEQVIRNAIDGLIEYRDRAIDILIKRIHAYEKHDDFDEAFNTLDKLEQIEPNIAKHERDELENNLPDWYVEEMYSRDNYEIEYYSREDSLRDALDDDPGSYWNID